jgi:hypothetical protein
LTPFEKWQRAKDSRSTEWYRKSGVADGGGGDDVAGACVEVEMGDSVANSLGFGEIYAGEVHADCDNSDVAATGEAMNPLHHSLQRKQKMQQYADDSLSSGAATDAESDVDYEDGGGGGDVRDHSMMDNPMMMQSNSTHSSMMSSIEERRSSACVSPADPTGAGCEMDHSEDYPRRASAVEAMTENPLLTGHSYVQRLRVARSSMTPIPLSMRRTSMLVGNESTGEGIMAFTEEAEEAEDEEEEEEGYDGAGPRGVFTEGSEKKEKFDKKEKTEKKEMKKKKGRRVSRRSSAIIVEEPAYVLEDQSSSYRVHEQKPYQPTAMLAASGFLPERRGSATNESHTM